jgi:hypothetical protein
MIDIRAEELLTLRDAAQFCPPRRQGKRAHPSCLYRWARDGVRGVRLEVLCAGATTCTSIEALQRFFNELTEKSACSSPTVSAPPKSATWDKALDDLGV